MFKRGPIIVGIILVLLVLAAPFAIGMINENAMQREVETLSGQPVFDVRIESFERGWFDSRALIQVGLDEEYLSSISDLGADPATAMLAGFTLPVIVEVGHGPVLSDDDWGLGTASVRAYIDPDSQVSILAEQFLGMPYVFELRGRSGFFGGFRYEGEIPAAELALPDMTVAATPFEFTGTWNGGDKAFDGELANLSMQSPYGSMIVESLGIASDTVQANVDELPLGTGGVSIGRMTISDPLQGATPTFSVEDLGAHYTAVADDAGTHVDMQLLYEVAALSAGADFNVSDTAVGINLNHLDAAALHELYRFTRTLSTMAAADPEALIASLQPPIEQIVAGGPSIVIDPLRLSMTEGDLDGMLNVTLDPEALPTGSLYDLQNPAVIMNALGIDAELTASKPLAQRLATLIMMEQAPAIGPDGEPIPPEQIEAMAASQAGIVLGGLAAQGIFVDEGETWSTSISVADGAATANGQPLPLMPF